MTPAAPKIVVVGGVAGGASAAARARRLAEDAQIVIFERGEHASFANCGLPYYLGGEIADRGKLLVAGPGRLQGWLNLDVRTQCEVTRIDRASKLVEVRELATGRTYHEAYDVLILAPGAAPLRPAAMLDPLGGGHPRVATLRSLCDVDRLKAIVDGSPGRAVIVGGGFIGLEIAEQLAHRGVPTSLVEMLPQVLPPFDPELVAPLEAALREAGVELRLGRGVERVAPLSAERVRVELTGGETLEAELVLLSLGVRPDTSLAAEAGLALNARGAIQTNPHLQSSDPAIYAVGDAIEVAEPILGGRTQIPLAGPANRQGRLAADHALTVQGATDWNPEAITFRGSQGTAIVRVCGQVAAMTGMSQKALERQGKRLHADFEVVYVHPTHHADYYPGAQRLTLKLVFALPDGRVLGGQCVGAEGVDKRIDVLSLLVQLRGTVYDLEQAELCYAPQFGSAKDPLNQAAFQATNVLRGITRLVTPGELAAALRLEGAGKGGTMAAAPAAPPLVLDVRTASEFAAGHVPGARNIPLDQLRRRAAEVPLDAAVVTYCAVGMRGYLAERILKQRGHRDVRNLSGGYRSWSQCFPDARLRA